MGALCVVDWPTKTYEPSHYSNCATVSNDESRRLQVPSKWTLEAICGFITQNTGRSFPDSTHGYYTHWREKRISLRFRCYRSCHSAFAAVCVCYCCWGPFFSPTSPYHPHILHSTILLTTFERLKNEFGLKHSRIVESRTTRHSSMDFGRRDEGTFGRAKIKQKPEKHENYLVGAFSPRRSLFSLLLYCVFPNSLFYEMAALHARHI